MLSYTRNGARQKEDPKTSGLRAKTPRKTGSENNRAAASSESGSWYEHLVNAVQDYAIFALDTNGNVLTWNAGAARLKGYTAGEIIGAHFSRFYTEADKKKGLPQQCLDSACRDGRFAGEGWRQRKDGSRFWASIAIAPIRDEGGTLIGFSKVTRDMSERKAAENALKNSEARFRSAISAMHDGLIIVDESGVVIECNSRASEILGVPAGSLHHQLFPDYPCRVTFPASVDWPTIASPVRQALKQGTPVWDALMEIRRPDDRSIWLTFSADPLFRDGIPKPRGAVVTFTDVTERREAEMASEAMMREALERADRDPLTNLYNHRTFHHFLQKAAKIALNVPGKSADATLETAALTPTAAAKTPRRRTKYSRPSFAVAVLDMDNFKFFNDTYGHLVGDEVLCYVADMLRTRCRQEDIVARIGGDEFAILMPHVRKAEARQCAQRLQALAHNLSFQPPREASPIPLRLSIGIAFFPDEADSADNALYLADKRSLRDKTGDDDSDAETRDQVERLRSLFTDEVDGFSMLDALVTAVDNKDRYTRRHSEEVMRYATLIAARLELSEEETTSLQVAALIHDVGKIGVPNKVLRRPGALSLQETESMRQHPVLGGILAEAVPELSHTLDAVRHHHERWDGQGYPHGLRGEAIPRPAQILAVADAYSAMTSNRPYRKGMPHEKAVSLLRGGMGSQWNEECVCALLDALDAPPTTVPV